MVADWMAGYIKDRQKEISTLHERQLQLAMARFSTIVFRCAPRNGVADHEANLKKLSELMLELSANPERWDTPEYQSRLAELERI